MRSSPAMLMDPSTPSHAGDLTEIPRVRRSSDTIWRVAADRVIVRVLGRDSHELQGSAALAWLELDQPRTRANLAARFAQLGVDGGAGAVVAALEPLLVAGLVEEC